MKLQSIGKGVKNGPGSGATSGLVRWLLDRMHRVRRSEPRLAVLERIALAPRQSLALIQAEGRRFLVATSPEGTPAFYALDDRIRGVRLRDEPEREQHTRKPAARVSW